MFDREFHVPSVSPYVRRLFVSSSSASRAASAAPAAAASTASPAPEGAAAATPRAPLVALADVELEALVHRYRLRSLVSHLGAGTDSGHYVSLRVAPANAGSGSAAGPAQGNERWLRASDTAVTNVSFDNVADSQAYLLFYERVS